VKYIGYLIAVVATVMVVLLFISNKDLKFKEGLLIEEIGAIEAVLEIKGKRYDTLNDILAVYKDSVLVVNDYLTLVNKRERDLIISYERRLTEIAEMSETQLDSFLIVNYPDSRDIVRDLVAFSHCKEMLINKDGTIKLLESKIGFKDDIIISQDSIITNLNDRLVLTEQLVDKAFEQADLNKKLFKRMRRQRNFAIAGGVGIAVLVGIVAN
jgi:hypothetical protein